MCEHARVCTHTHTWTHTYTGTHVRAHTPPTSQREPACAPTPNCRGLEAASPEGKWLEMSSQRGRAQPRGLVWGRGGPAGETEHRGVAELPRLFQIPLPGVLMRLSPPRTPPSARVLESPLSFISRLGRKLWNWTFLEDEEVIGITVPQHRL